MDEASVTSTPAAVGRAEMIGKVALADDDDIEHPFPFRRSLAVM